MWLKPSASADVTKAHGPPWTVEGAVPMGALHSEFAFDLTCHRPELCLGVAEENKNHFPQCASA